MSTAPSQLPDEAAYVAWLGRIEDSETIADLLRLPTDHVRYLVGRHAPAHLMSEAVLRDLFIHARSRAGLLRNPSLTDAQCRTLCLWALAHALSGTHDHLSEILPPLAEAGRRLPVGEMLQQLRALLAKPENDHRRAAEQRRAAGLLLHFWVHLSAADLELAHRYGYNSLDFDIARHPNVSADALDRIWTRAAREHAVATMRAVAEHPLARTEGALRNAVLAEAEPYSLAHAMTGRPAEEIEAALLRLAEAQPRRAFDFLRTLTTADRRRLAPAALAPLLACEASEIRTETQLMLSDLRTLARAIEPPPVALSARELPLPVARRAARTR